MQCYPSCFQFMFLKSNYFHFLLSHKSVSQVSAWQLLNKRQVKFSVSPPHKITLKYLISKETAHIQNLSYSHIITPFDATAQMLNHGKAIPIQAWTDPQFFRKLRLPEFLFSQHMKVAKLSTLPTGRLQPHAESTAGTLCIQKIKSISDTIGNRTCNLPVSSVVPQATAPLHTIQFMNK